MGISSSKLDKHEQSVIVQEGSIPSTPILTPKTLKPSELDPRSPSTFISRTPIEVLSAAAKKLEHFEESAIADTPLCNKHILLGIDPRSPTAEFKRTPILISATENELPKAILNKNLEKVIQSELRTPKHRNDRASKIVPPKLLDSSPIEPKPEAYKRKSFVGLLETNIDFTETDIDEVFQQKCKGKSESSTAINKIDVVQSENVDPRSPTTDFLRTPIQIVKKIGEIDLNIEDDNLQLGKIEIENYGKNTEEKNENKESSVETLVHDAKQDTSIGNIEAVALVENIPIDIPEVCKADESETVTLDEKETVEIPDGTKSAPVTPPHINVSEEEILPQKCHRSAPATPPHSIIDVQDADRKVTLPIYEDDDIIVCPRVVKIKEYVERSPLRIWNGGAEVDRKKSGQKLKVSDKPRKSDGVCKIPVYKERVKKSSVQCENTPPRNMDIKKKAKPCLWDNADKTLYL